MARLSLDIEPVTCLVNFPVNLKSVLNDHFLLQNYRQEANDITKGDVYNNSFYLNTMNYNLQYVLPELNHLEVSVGLNGMKQNSQNRGTVFLVPEYNLFDVGAFVTAMKTIKKLSISGGFRYQLRNLKGNDFYTDSSGAKR